MREVVRPAFHVFSADLEGQEIPFMYLDSVGLDKSGNEDGTGRKGLVTIATGCLIDPVSMATGLPFVRPDGGLATMAEIVACWERVKDRQDLRKHGGMIYGGLAGNTLRLTAGATRNLVDKRLAWFDAELEALFPDWAEWPACAQLFGLSWAWAVGVHAKYPKMIALLRNRDFAGAAWECTVTPNRGTIATRNERNRALLHNADRVQAYHLDYDLLTWDVVLGVSDAETQPDITLPSSIPPGPLPQIITDIPPSLESYPHANPVHVETTSADGETIYPRPKKDEP